MPTAITAKEKYKAFKKKYEEARKELTEQASEAFKEFAKDIFEEFPGLESFGWTQYTPYFNDGDACEFSANTSYESGIYINDLNEDDDDNEDDDGIDCVNKECAGTITESEKFCSDCGTAAPKVEPGMTENDIKKARKAVVEMMKNFDDAILLDLYDDHAHVTIMRNGKAKIKEYSHD